MQCVVPAPISFKEKIGKRSACNPDKPKHLMKIRTSIASDIARSEPAIWNDNNVDPLVWNQTLQALS
jgi:hypothetical protein